MRTAIALLALAAVASATHAFNAESAFRRFMTEHKKSYPTKEEFSHRFATFKSNLDAIQTLNKRHVASGGEKIYAPTKFADLTQEEFKASQLGYKGHKLRRQAKTVDTIEALPTSFDWRTKGAVTPVKNQGQCGSCWAFSATEEIESMWFLSGKPLAQLSPQQIVSCDKTDAGCNGGDTTTAYAYVESAGGLESETAYPYTSGAGVTGACKFSASGIIAHLSGFVYATQTHNETQMAVATANVGPISICVDASTWQFYTGGIITSNCGQQLDHCVQIVGYNMPSGSTPYWIVRNSWATDWGIQGFLYVEMGKNLCGISNEATIVTI